MGIDARLCAVSSTPFTKDDLEWAEDFIADRLGDPIYGGRWLTLEPEGSPHGGGHVIFNTGYRFFGTGYQRGPWGRIYTEIRVLQAALPRAKVFYGNDTDTTHGVAVTNAYMNQLWRVWLGQEHPSW